MELGSYFLFLQEQIKDIIIIDGWGGREHILYMFTNNDTELHQLIIDDDDDAF
jgi:predicted fused transcriptional regulator/phosphomethylpyrimidine kinase